ncbi:hypothetical protein ACFLZ4_01290, partial [Patescibacteria group bacterium]
MRDTKKKYLKIFLGFYLFTILMGNLSPIFAAPKGTDDPGGDAIFFGQDEYEDPVNIKYEKPFNCNPEREIFEQSEKFFDLDIRRTINNAIVGIFISMFANTVGVDLYEAVGCEQYFYDHLGKFRFPPDAVGEPCYGTDDERCEVLANEVKLSQASPELRNSVHARAIGGSLMGISHRFENFSRYEPVPVNLAYFWNRSIEKIPVVNKAFAADEPSYGLPLVQAVFNVWKLARDVALGFMSVILLYTGIMIILRKKINSQLVVSVQYAIPKIVIGLLLIIFSYPIGATITSIAWALYKGGYQIVFNAASSSWGGPGGAVGSGLMLLGMLVGVVNYGTTAMGFAMLLVVVIIMVVCTVLNILVHFKAMTIYIKMIFGILTAPFELAVGTIPGGEEKIVDWFKKMAKLAVTITAMGLVIPVVIILALSLMD